jgi:hypothetical protein
VRLGPPALGRGPGRRPRRVGPTLAFLLTYQSLPLPRSREKQKISSFIMFILHIAPRALRHERTDLAHERPMTPHAQLFGVDPRFLEVGEQEARHRIPRSKIAARSSSNLRIRSCSARHRRFRSSPSVVRRRGLRSVCASVPPTFVLSSPRFSIRAAAAYGSEI